MTDENFAMTHHARLARLVVAPAIALTAVLALAACSSGGGTNDSQDEMTTTTLTLVVNASQPLVGIQLDLHHDSRLTVLGVEEGASLGSATCQENVTSGRVQAACVTSVPLSTPFVGWTIDVQHSTSIDAADGVTSIACTGTNASAQSVTTTCAID